MIDFLRYRTACLAFSLAIIGGFVGMAVYRQQTRGSVFILSVDFTGGTQVLLNFENPVDSAAVKAAVSDAGWKGTTARYFSKHDIVVRVADFSSDVQGVATRILDTVRVAFPGNNITIKQTEHVGEGVGQNLWWRSLLAILLALIFMLAYIAIRFFSFSYALGAVIALFHDALVMMGVFLLFDREISINVIGAILAIMGYSINDTIVIFSRIRDRIRTSRGARIGDVVNQSINHTLKRTILTSISTGLPVGAMLILGGEALRDFSIALMVGIIFGTYSSIYIASPIMMLFHNNKN